MNSEWHNLTIEDIYNDIKSSKEGLKEKEVEKRLKQYGKNIIPKQQAPSFIKIMINQLMDPIVLILIVAMIFSFIINETVDGLAILFIITIDILMGTFQEWKAGKNALNLSKLLEIKLKVLRDNKEIEIDSSDLVIGDIVFIESGNKISADLRIIESSNITIDESVLTGESLSVEKNSKILKEETPLAERTNMMYAGTNVLTGRAVAIVVATGINTEIGKIATNVSSFKEEKSPLTIRMETFSKQISLLIIFVAIIIAILLYIKKVPEIEIFLSVIALSVSAMPEGLPLALTMSLTIASNKMSKKNVIVKKLNSVESLGSCTVIATDKTGTLTVNEQTAKKILLPDGSNFDIEGVGYNDKGKVLAHGSSKIIDATYIAKLGVINNEAHLIKTKNGFEKFGDSIDIAFKALGLKLNIDTAQVEIISRIPYESENKYSAVFYKEQGKTYCSIKGSLEKVLTLSSTMKINDQTLNIDQELIKEQNDTLAKEGYRVIATAVKEIKESTENLPSQIKDFTFIGLTAFIDPIRKEVKKAIKECKSAGIKVIMITGDHPFTAFKIAKELDLATNLEEVATGMEVDNYLKKDVADFDQFVKQKKVFTRVTPMNKLQIIQSYKRQNEFIAVTGDGVNDAPALKAANIGIAMGSGTDVAKETSSMIILDDNFKSIVSGIKEGRTAYSNIRKVSYMLLSCGVAEVLFFILSIALNMPMPLIAVQLLWLNIVTDGLQDFALSFEKTESSIMSEKPRSPKETLFNKELINEVLISGISIGIIVFILWYYLINILNINLNIARGYIMMLMVFIQNIHVLNCRSEKNSIFKTPIKTNPLIIFTIVSSIILQIIVSEVPIFNKLLQVRSIPLIDIIYLFLISTIIILIMELYKKIHYKKNIN